MKSLFILASVTVVLFIAFPNNVEAQKRRPAARIVIGTISGYSCGDNCYLTITDEKRKEHMGLCTAPVCLKWNEKAEMPKSYIGKRVKVTIGKGKQLYGDGSVFGPFDAFTIIQFLTVPEAAKTVDANAFYGIWESNNEIDGKLYWRITNAGMGMFRLENGFPDLAGNIEWMETEVKNADGIYLKIVNGKLTGRFASYNFRPTHSNLFTYKITCTLQSDNRLFFSLWSQNGLTTVSVATKLTEY